MENLFKQLFKEVIEEQLSISQEREYDKADVCVSYTREEVCGILKISIATLKRFRANGTLVPTFYVGRSPRYSKEAIESYIDRNKCCD